MPICCWTCFQTTGMVELEASLLKGLRAEGLEPKEFDGAAGLCPGILVASQISSRLHETVQSARRAGSTEIIVILTPGVVAEAGPVWDLLRSGASDVLNWTTPERIAKQVHARLARALAIERLVESHEGDGVMAGRSLAWRGALCQIVEIARFSDTPALILGESGTGKEVAARLIHRIDARQGKREMIVQDCSTMVQDLSGSEFFGHERGAFTGASSDRQGAFALANGGTLFLDEIGELPLPVQAQLLRAIQEGTFRRVGGTAWQRTDFRLICATNRNLDAMVQRGEFRGDLYHRIAGHVCRLPPLRERLEDVLPLAHAFMRQARGGDTVPTLDPMVRTYLLQRAYPGNVRELRQVVGRLMNRWAGAGAISIGCVPPDERPSGLDGPAMWFDGAFETVIRRAVMMGAGLKEVGRVAEDCAIRCAVAAEDGSLRRAAERLGVTDRALQLRRAQVRDTGSSRLGGDGVAHH